MTDRDIRDFDAEKLAALVVGNASALAGVGATAVEIAQLTSKRATEKASQAAALSSIQVMTRSAGS